jgi:hypothetical protein
LPSKAAVVRISVDVSQVPQADITVCTGTERSQRAAIRADHVP